MVKEKFILEVLSEKNLGGTSVFQISHSIIETIDLNAATDLRTHLVIENCVIKNLLIHSCWFKHGFTMKNCVVINGVDYQMGGHNFMPIILEGNIFNEFFNFFDCQFGGFLEVSNNIFLKGTNLLGNQNEGFRNLFDSGYKIENNLGILDLD